MSGEGPRAVRRAARQSKHWSGDTKVGNATGEPRLRNWQEIRAMVHGSAAKGGPDMFATMIKLFKNEDGATAIEYGLIAALLACDAVHGLGTVGTNLTATFTTVDNLLLMLLVEVIFRSTFGGAKRC